MAIIFHTQAGPSFPPAVPWVETFTGVNGESANTLYWTSILDDGSSVINNNKIRVTSSSSGADGIETSFNVSGDFDIYVDYTMSEFSSIEGWAPILDIRVDDINKILIYEEGWSGTTNYIKMSSWINDSRTNIVGPVNGLSARFRVVRTGAVWYGYYDSGSGWQLLGSRSIGTDTVTLVRISNSNWTSRPTTWVDFDNFTIAQGTLVEKPPSFGLQLKEQKRLEGYASGLTVSWASKLNLNLSTAGLCHGLVFVSVPKTVLDGKIVKVEWALSISSSRSWQSDVDIVDGKYDRNDAGDFPETIDTPYVTKGTGVLYNENNVGIFSRETYTSPALDLSSSVLDDVTIIVRVEDVHAGDSGVLSIYKIQILDGVTLEYEMVADGEITYTNNSDWDYGTYGDPDTFYN